MISSSRRKALLLSSALAVVIFHGVAMAQPPAVYPFDIPAESLGQALKDYSTASSRQILFSTDAVAGRTSRELRGSYTPDQALDMLLAGTDLRADTSRSGVIMVRPKNVEAASDPGAGAEEVIVSASRLDRMDVPTPQFTVTSQVLREGARSNIAVSLADMPQFKLVSSASTSASNIMSGIFNLELRGLGPTRTLDLIDGRRIVASESRPDLSIIPSILIDRVDVVTGSASAAWGSNAVAGVVNFIVNEKLDGLHFGVRGGVSQHGYAGEEQVEAAWGSDFNDGRGHVVVGGEFFNNGGAPPRATQTNFYHWAVASNPNFTPTNGQKAQIFAPDVGFADASLGGLILSGVNKGQTFNPDGTLRPFNFGRVSGTTSIGGEAPSFDDTVKIAAPSQRYDVLGRLTYQLRNDLKVTAQILYGRTYNDFPWLADPDRGNLTVSVQNAFLPAAVHSQMLAAGESSFTFGRFNSDFATVKFNSDRATAQGTLAFDGDLGGSWRWNAFYSHGEFDEDLALRGQIIKANLGNALDSVISPTTGQPVCRVALANPSTSCVPINLFGFGAPSAAATAYVEGTAVQRQQTILDNGGVTVRGELPDVLAGPVSFAAGFEARREALNTDVSPLDQANAFQLLNFAAFHGANTTKEGFSEIQVPVVRDIPLLNLLQFNGAARLTNDSTGSIWSWKLGAVDEIYDGVSLRFTRSRDIRAPSLIERFQPIIGPGFLFIADPQTQTSYSVPTFSGGNPNLRPEASLATTAGITVTPSVISGLKLSADYFDISIANAIATITAQNSVTACFQGNQGACSGITRGANGLVTSISASQLNFTAMKTRGLDGAADYSIPLENMATIGLRNAFTLTTEYTTNDGILLTDYLGTHAGVGFGTLGVPKFRMTTSLYYTDDTYDAYLRSRFISSGSYNSALPIQNNAIPAYMFFDLGMAMHFETEDRTKLEVYGDINNALGKGAPSGTATSPFYDILGRYFAGGIRVQL